MKISYEKFRRPDLTETVNDFKVFVNDKHVAFFRRESNGRSLVLRDLRNYSDILVNGFPVVAKNANELSDVVKKFVRHNNFPTDEDIQKKKDMDDERFRHMVIENDLKNSFAHVIADVINAGFTIEEAKELMNEVRELVEMRT